jgi:hypothetical protein
MELDPHIERHLVTLLKLLACAAALTNLASAPALAHDFKCGVPKSEWRPQMELQAKLLADGWRKVRQVKVDIDCYEVYGFDEKNERAEKFYNPKTFEKVGEIKQK